MKLITFISSLLRNKHITSEQFPGRFEPKPSEGWFIDSYFGANWDHDTIWYYEKRRWRD